MITICQKENIPSYISCSCDASKVADRSQKREAQRESHEAHARNDQQPSTHHNNLLLSLELSAAVYSAPMSFATGVMVFK